MPDEALRATDGYYFPISPLLLFPQSRGSVGVYLRLKDRYLLWAHPKEPFDHDNLNKLQANGVEEVYVLAAHRQQFEDYLESNLGPMLLDDSCPMARQAKLLYDASVSMVREAFQSRLPGGLTEQMHQKFLQMATMGVQFLMREDSFESMAALSPTTTRPTVTALTSSSTPR